MKYKITLFACAALLMTGCTSDKFEIPAGDVPAAVLNAYQQKYPNTEATEWDAAKEGGSLVYVVCLKVNDKKIKSSFRPDGTFINEK